jgi:hypothetical protein
VGAFVVKPIRIDGELSRGPFDQIVVILSVLVRQDAGVSLGQTDGAGRPRDLCMPRTWPLSRHAPLRHAQIRDAHR